MDRKREYTRVWADRNRISDKEHLRTQTNKTPWLGAAQQNWHAKSIFQSSGLKSVYDGMRQRVGIQNAANMQAAVGERERGHLELSHRQYPPWVYGFSDRRGKRRKWGGGAGQSLTDTAWPTFMKPRVSEQERETERCWNTSVHNWKGKD